MYLWQYWRDTRRGVYVYLGILLLFVATWVIGMIHANRVHHISGSAANLWDAALGMTFTVTWLCALILTFVLGNNNVGSEIGKGTGDFLLTRPRPRQYFVWAGWAAGMAEVLALMTISALIAMGCMTFAIGPALWQALWATPVLTKGALLSSVPLVTVSLVLTAATIFGLTYFLTVLFKNAARGVVTSLGIVFGYSVLGGLLKTAGISLPGLTFVQHAGVLGTWYLPPRVEIPLWTVLALAFPFAAQVVLSRSDI